MRRLSGGSRSLARRKLVVLGWIPTPLCNWPAPSSRAKGGPERARQHQALGARTHFSPLDSQWLLSLCSTFLDSSRKKTVILAKLSLVAGKEHVFLTYHPFADAVEFVPVRCPFFLGCNLSSTISLRPQERGQESTLTMSYEVATVVRVRAGWEMIFGREMIFWGFYIPWIKQTVMSIKKVTHDQNYKPRTPLIFGRNPSRWPPPNLHPQYTHINKYVQICVWLKRNTLRC